MASGWIGDGFEAAWRPCRVTRLARDFEPGEAGAGQRMTLRRSTR